MDVAIITQTYDTETDQGTHVQGQDGDEERLGALQVTVEEDGHEHNLQERARALNPRQMNREESPCCLQTT